MSTFKGTQGIWSLEENTNHYPFVMGEDSNVIAPLFKDDGTLFYGRSLEETQANAKLICAAPDLLDSANDYKHLLELVLEHKAFLKDFSHASLTIDYARLLKRIKKATE